MLKMNLWIHHLKQVDVAEVLVKPLVLFQNQLFDPSSQYAWNDL